MMDDIILVVPTRRKDESLKDWYQRCILIYNLGDGK